MNLFCGFFIDFAFFPSVEVNAKIDRLDDLECIEFSDLQHTDCVCDTRLVSGSMDKGRQIFRLFPQVVMEKRQEDSESQWGNIPLSYLLFLPFFLAEPDKRRIFVKKL